MRAMALVCVMRHCMIAWKSKKCSSMKLTLALVIFVYQCCQFLTPAHKFVMLYHDIAQVASVLGREWVLIRGLDGGMLVGDEHWTKSRWTIILIQMNVIFFRLHVVYPFALKIQWV